MAAFSNSLFLSKTVGLALIVAIGISLAAKPVQAQEESPPNEAEKKLESLLDKIDTIYKKKYNARSKRWMYIADFSGQSTKTRMMFEAIPQHTLKNGKKLYMVRIVTVITQIDAGKKFSAGVLNRVAAINIIDPSVSLGVSGTLLVGMSASYIDGLTGNSLLLMMIDLHRSHIAVGKEIDKLIKTEALEG